MRGALYLLLACPLLCGCHRTPAEGPRTERPPLKRSQPDLLKISDLVFERYGKLGYEKLSQPEKVFVCVWDLESEVNNGGFDQYYFNSSGDHALDALESLNTIGAKHTADLVKQANTLFGAAGPSPDQEKREKQLDALSETATKKLVQIEREFFKYNDNLQELLTAYVSRNAEAFRPK